MYPDAAPPHPQYFESLKTITDLFTQNGLEWPILLALCETMCIPLKAIQPIFPLGWRLLLRGRSSGPMHTRCPLLPPNFCRIDYYHCFITITVYACMLAFLFGVCRVVVAESIFSSL